MNNMKNVDTGTYGLPWLDSVLEENLLPGAPWHKVNNPVPRALLYFTLSAVYRPPVDP